MALVRLISQQLVSVEEYTGDDSNTMGLQEEGAYGIYT